MICKFTSLESGTLKMFPLEDSGDGLSVSSLAHLPVPFLLRAPEWARERDRVRQGPAQALDLLIPQACRGAAVGSAGPVPAGLPPAEPPVSHVIPEAPAAGPRIAFQSHPRERCDSGTFLIASALQCPQEPNGALAPALSLCED